MDLVVIGSNSTRTKCLYQHLDPYLYITDAHKDQISQSQDECNKYTIIIKQLYIIYLIIYHKTIFLPVIPIMALS